MQRKFQLVEPKKDVNVAKWVSMTSESQNAATAGSPRVTLSSRSEYSFVNRIHVESNREVTASPKSVKVLCTPVFFKDSTDVFPKKRKKKLTKKLDNIPAPTDTVESQNVTPKVIFSPGIVRDTKDWRLEAVKSSKIYPSSAGLTQRSFLSGSGDYLDSSRTVFKPEFRQNANVSNWVTVVGDSNISDDDCRIPPTFSARTEDDMHTENMSETVLQPRKQSVMGNKVGESRKEIEKLKTELETLINTNLKNKNIIPQHSEPETNIENVPTTITNISSNVKQKVIVSPSKITKSPTSVRRKSSTLNSDTNLNTEEPKCKSKTYDPESTREFIRKQKLRRKEKLQQEELKKKEIEESKKQKLENLKQRTLQLVNENVKKSSSKKVCAKRSEENLTSKSNAQLVNNKSSQNLTQIKKTRARSFDREAIKQSKANIQQSANKPKEKPWQRSRSVSRELNVRDKKSPVKSRRSVAENQPNSTNTKSNPQVELDEVVNKISQFLNNDLDKKDNNKDEAATKIQAAFRGYQQRNKNSKSESAENISIKPKSDTAPNIKNSETNVAKEIESRSNIPSEVVEKPSLPKYDEEIKVSSKNVIPSKITNLEEILKNIPEEIIKSINHSEEQKEAVKNNDTLTEVELIKQKLETSISQSNLENKRNETPAWLLPPSTLPYPYNFISAVRKKLEIATKNHTSVAKDIKLQSPNTEKFTKDTSIQTLENNRKSNVSIQCSLENSREIKDTSTPKIIPPKPEELRTFMSHKCRKQLVYNSPPKLQSPTNVKDTSKEIKSQKHNSVKSKSKTILTSETSDSDTAKNIPEISEEEQFPKHYSAKSEMFENVKNITLNRPINGKNFTFDEIKVDNNSSGHESKKLSIKSEHSDRLKNITFDRRTNNDISNLIKPDYKIDTSKISKHSIEHQSNRSKYPSDIDSILSQYSRMKSSSKSNIHNDSQNSQYSEDFNSSTNHLSLPHSKSNKDLIKQEEDSSEPRKNISKAGSTDLSKIKSDILASLAQQHSSSLSNIPKQISDILSSRNQSTDINVESLNKISNGSQISARRSIRNSLELNSKNTDIKSNNSLESLNKSSSKITEIKTKNSSSSVPELSIKNYSEATDNNLKSQGKYSSKFNSESQIKHTSKSDISKIKSRNSFETNLTESQIKTNSNNISHSKLEESEIKTKNSSSSVPELSIKNYSDPTDNNLKSRGKYSSFNSQPSDIESQIKHASKSDISKIKSKNLTESQIKTNTNTISHSKIEESVIASSIPEDSVAVKTDSQSAQESNIIKSSIEDSLKQRTASLKTDPTIQSLSEIFEKSESKSVLKPSNIQNLSKPAVNLKIEKEKFFRDAKNNPNQIHLKFQAEVHLLNSFNNSLQQVVAVEKSLLDIQKHPPSSMVNFSRGCGAPEHIESLSVLEPSVCSQDLAMSRLSDTVASEAGVVTERSVLSETCSSVVSNRENAVAKNPYVGVSLGMYDQMIRDEDNRLEHLKAILKLRDKALFDRTKGELAWLEIQKKQLRENGQLNDVTIIKKKQRGLIIKLEQERHEMQRLKQAHKQAAKERKNALREQKNIIKQQLSSTDQIPTKIRRLSHLERRQSGPVKVYRVESRTEHVRETTMSRNNSGTDETISVTTSSVVTQISEKVSVDQAAPPENSLALKPFPKSSVVAAEKAKSSDKHSEKVKRALLMKEADLEKRRKEAEELLKWHERLKQEEAQVVELERQAKSIQLDDHEKKRVLTGAQLNKIWKGITGSVEKKFDDHKKYQMSKRSLDKFYQNARKIFKEISEERNSSKRGSETSYTSDFDPSHSPSKINLSSSIVTQINDSDLSISPNKLLSERLRKISESSRLDFITSAKNDTDVSEQSTVSEKTQPSTDKKSVVSEILSVDQTGQNETDSNMQTVKDSSIHSVISELNHHESTASRKSIPSEIKSQIISNHELNNSSVTKESVPSVEEQIRNSSTDSNLPELQTVDEIYSDKESIQIKTEKSTDSDLPGLEVDSELDINSEHIRSVDIESEYVQNIEKSKSIEISEHSHLQNISEHETQKSETPISEISKLEPNKSSRTYNESQILSVVESIIDDEPNKTDSKVILSESSKLESNKSSRTYNESQILSVVESIIDDEPNKTDSKVILSESSKLEPNKSSITYNDSQILSVVESIIDDEPNKTDSKLILSESSKLEPNKSSITYNESQFLSVVESIIDDEPNKSESNQIITETNKSRVSSDSLQVENKTTTPEENIHFTPKEDTNISVSKEIISAESEQKITSDISPKTTRSEENTSKNIDENILLPSDSQESEVEVDDRSNKKAFVSAEEDIKSNLDDSTSAKSSDLQESSTIQSYTLVDENLSENKENDSEHSSISEHSNHLSENKKSERLSSKVSIQSEIESNSNIKSDLLIENDTVQIAEIESVISNKTENHDTTITSETEKSTVDSEFKSSIDEEFDASKLQVSPPVISESSVDLVDSEVKSKVEEPKSITSQSLHEEFKDSTSKSQENVQSVSSKTLIEPKSNVETEEQISESHDDFEKKSKSEFILEEFSPNNQNIQSEVSTPHESEPYYQTDFERLSETDFTSETNESNEATYAEKDVSDSENIQTFKSSISTETEKESTTKIESPKDENSESFESEKESGTIIESPKSIISTKENDIKSTIEENSEVPSSESQVITNLSQKSVSTEGEESTEENKESSEHSMELQNDDTNVVGVSHIDVRKRVSEILADTTPTRGDKSPRLQDLYVTTYDVMTNSAESTPETGSPTNESNKRDKSSFTIGTPYRTEAEELLRKQLEIEQEIKQLERQQQNIPYLFMREIPNKPPPPYKPPNAAKTPVVNSVIPVHADQIRKFVKKSADVLFQAYVAGNLKEVSYKCNEDSSQKFVFDLCKEIALEVCKPMEETRIPSWKSQKNKFQTLISRRPVNKEGLCSVMNRRVLHLLNFEPVVRKDNLIIRWSRKKRDHVDEILVLESQTEETEWTNYDSDEQTIKDNLTSDIMNMLILETAQVMCEILKKKRKMLWTNHC